MPRALSPERKERFVALLLPHRNRLMGFARAMSGSEEDARDLFADTVAAALQGFDRLRSDDAFLSWLLTIASRLQKRRRYRGRLFERYDAASDPDVRSARDDRPDEGPDIELLYAALRRLPSQQSEAIILHEITGLPLEDIRAIQGGSLSAVKMRLHRGRRRLAELLGADDDQNLSDINEHGHGTATLHD